MLKVGAEDQIPDAEYRIENDGLWGNRGALCSLCAMRSAQQATGKLVNGLTDPGSG